MNQILLIIFVTFFLRGIVQYLEGASLMLITLTLLFSFFGIISFIKKPCSELISYFLNPMLLIFMIGH